MGLDSLRSGLLYNNVVDVWMSLCEEKGWEYTDRMLHVAFIKYLKAEGIPVQKLPVCPPEGGSKGEVAKRTSVLLGDPVKSFVLRTDSKLIERLRSFDPRSRA